jgi:acyl-CoA thioesterase I
MPLAALRVLSVLVPLLIAAHALAQAPGKRVPAAQASSPPSLHIVAVGASNTSGWGVGAANAYPARLETLLRAKGYDAHVANAGMPFETTVGMRERIDAAVPDGTDLVIIQPGSNDKRFLWALPLRKANIEAMVHRLDERKIKSIVFDPDFPWSLYQWDFIHLSNEGHAWTAEALLPQVIAAVTAARPQAPTNRAARTTAPPAKTR